MMRTLIPLLCLLAIAGCSKKTASPPGQTGAQPMATTRSPAMDDDDAPKRMDAPEQKVEINDEMVKRYLTYWERNIEISNRAMTEIRQATQEAERKGGSVGVAHALGNGEAIEERAEAQHDALLDVYGFTEYQVRELAELMRAVAAQKKATASAGTVGEVQLAEARKRFGDEAVNAALAHASEISALNEKTFRSLR